MLRDGASKIDAVNLRDKNLHSAMMFNYQTPIVQRDDQPGAARNKRANI
jgi:hypothetical protein